MRESLLPRHRLFIVRADLIVIILAVITSLKKAMRCQAAPTAEITPFSCRILAPSGNHMRAGVAGTFPFDHFSGGIIGKKSTKLYDHNIDTVCLHSILTPKKRFGMARDISAAADMFVTRGRSKQFA